MNRWLKLTCAAALACGACVKSQVASEADIQVTGQVLQEDKQPLANTLLTFSRSANSECLFTLFFGDAEWKSVKTGADGTFSQTWLGADTQSGGTARCFSLSTPTSAKGGSVYTEFRVQSEQLQLPLLQQWTGTPASAAVTAGVNVSFKNLSETQPDVGTLLPVLNVQSPTGYVWAMDTQGSPTLIDDDFLEDARDLSAVLLVTRSVTSAKNTFSINYRSDSVALPVRTHVPLSRGASCTYPEAPTTACPLTDGNLGATVSFKPGTRQVAIQLAQPQVLHKALLRNVHITTTPRALVLEGSADGTTWLPLGSLLDASAQVRSFIEVPITSSTALSQVRLSLDDPNDVSIQWLSEVSLF